jgi:trimethylamine--corrinoid protein Co-methyltransferase
MLSDWRNYETWADDGRKTATERANAIWKQLLAEFEPPPIEVDRAEAIAAFVERRTREIGGGS